MSQEALLSLTKLEARGAEIADLTRMAQDHLFHSTPAWSPDGTRLSFVYDSDIYVADVAGKTLVNITNHDLSPSWDDYAWRPR